MKNALILTGMWVAIIIAAYTIVYWDGSTGAWLPITVLQDEESSAAYVHPGGEFDVAAPPEWRVIAEERGVRLSSTDDLRTIWIVAVDEEDLCRAIDAARAEMTLDDLSLISSGAPAIDDPCSGTRIRLRFEDETTERVLLARARQEDQWSLVLLAMGSNDEEATLERDVEWIWERLRVPAAPPVVL